MQETRHFMNVKKYIMIIFVFLMMIVRSINIGSEMLKN